MSLAVARRSVAVTRRRAAGRDHEAAEAAHQQPGLSYLRRVPIPILVAPMALLCVLVATLQARLPMLVSFVLLGCTFLLPALGSGWILAPLLLTEFVLTNYFVTQVGASLRLLVVVTCAVLALRSMSLGALWSEPAFRRVFIPAAVFMLISTLVNMQFSQSDYVMKYARYQVLQVLTVIIAAATLRSGQDLRRLVKWCLILGLATAVASIWQHYERGSAPYVAISGASAVRSFKSRSVGLASNPVDFPNHVLFVLTPLLALLAMGGSHITMRRLLLGLTSVTMVIGLYFSYTRSALLAAGIGVLTTVPFVPKFSRVVIGAAVLVAVIAYPLLQEAAAEGDGDASQRLFQDAENDQSAAGHVALLQVGVAIAMDYPFTGVGHEHFEDIAMDYINVVDLGGAETEAQGEATIGKQRPHNDWLSVWVSWGIGALLAYSCVFVGTFINCLHTLRHSSPLCRVLAVGCIAGLAQYAVNSFLHNYLDSSLLLFVYAGVSVALVRIASDQDERRKRLGPNRRTPRSHVDSRARRAAFA